MRRLVPCGLNPSIELAGTLAATVLLISPTHLIFSPERCSARPDTGGCTAEEAFCIARQPCYHIPLNAERRPVALRPTLSGSLPLSGYTVVICSRHKEHNRPKG